MPLDATKNGDFAFIMTKEALPSLRESKVKNKTSDSDSDSDLFPFRACKYNRLLRPHLSGALAIGLSLLRGITQLFYN